MSHFIIDAKDLKSFLASILLDGLVFDCLLQVKQKGITCVGLDTAKAIYFNLRKKTSVKKVGKLAIGNIVLFMKMLARFDGDVEILVEKKIVKIKQKRKIARIETAKVKSIDSFSSADAIQVEDNVVKTPKIKGNFKSNYIVVKAEQLQEIVKDADTLDEHIYSFDLQKKAIIVKVKKDSSSFSTKVRPSEVKITKPMTIDLGHGAKEVFGALEGEAKVFFESSFPGILIRHGNKFKNIHIITKRG